MVYEIRYFNERGSLAHVRRVTCENDDAALDWLAGVRHPHALELWQADRLVWRFDEGTV